MTLEFVLSNLEVMNLKSGKQRLRNLMQVKFQLLQ